MKTLRFLTTILVLTTAMCVSTPSEAQFWKKLKEHAKRKIKREAERRSERRVDKGIDKTFDKAEDVIDGKEKDENTQQKQGDDIYNEDNMSNGTPQQKNKKKEPQVIWSRFDFVPGDEVIFEDAPSPNEENGEFPSRWDLVQGNGEIIEVNGEKVVSFPQGGKIIPYLRNSKEDYLPEVFTIEFDTYFRPKYSRRVWLQFFDVKHQRNSTNNERLGFHINSTWVGNSAGTLPNKKGNWSKNGGWRHFSIAFTKGKIKVYIGETRLINIPHYEGNPTGITIEIDGYSSDKPEDLQYIKNFRIAKGGVKYYDRAMQDGKIIVNGIKFDVNKTTLRPESMGPINKIFELMQKNPELKFSVEGHTDSDGNDANNQTLSEGRAKTVMDKLVAMGISQDRLTCKGWGESKPIAENTSAEGKANNRRVEFVKF